MFLPPQRCHRRCSPTTSGQDEGGDKGHGYCDWHKFGTFKHKGTPLFSSQNWEEGWEAVAIRSTLVSVASVGLILAACSGVGTPTPTGTPIPVTQTAPTVLNENITEGAELHATNCQVFHGDLRGPGGSGAPPHNQYGHTWHHPDAQFKDWVINGKLGFSQMPAFKNILTGPEVDAVLSYIKTSWNEDQRETQADVSVRYQEALDKRKEGQ